MIMVFVPVKLVTVWTDWGIQLGLVEMLVSLVLRLLVRLARLLWRALVKVLRRLSLVSDYESNKETRENTFDTIDTYR